MLTLLAYPIILGLIVLFGGLILGFRRAGKHIALDLRTQALVSRIVAALVVFCGSSILGWYLMLLSAGSMVFAMGSASAHLVFPLMVGFGLGGAIFLSVAGYSLAYMLRLTHFVCTTPT